MKVLEATVCECCGLAYMGQCFVLLVYVVV